MKRCARVAQQRHQFRQPLDVLAMDFDELEPAACRMRGADRGMRGLDQRRLAHAARAPQQRIVGRQAAREALGVLDQEVAHPVDALEQRHLDAVDARAPASSRARLRVPDEGVGRGEVGRGGGRRREPLQRLGDPREQALCRRRQSWQGSARLGRACRRPASLLPFAGLRGRFGHFDHRVAAPPLAGPAECPQAFAPAAQCCAAALQLGRRPL